MDIVICLNNKLSLTTNSLKYVIRSIQENVNDNHNLFIIGNPPKGIIRAEIIPAEDEGNDPKEIIFNKLKKTVDLKNLSENFLFWPQETLAVGPQSASSMPFYADQTGQASIQKPFIFENKSPLRLNKGLLKKMSQLLDAKQSRTWRSAYGNLHNVPTLQFSDNFVTYNDEDDTWFIPFSAEGLASIRKGGSGYSTLFDLLDKTFPYPSPEEA